MPKRRAIPPVWKAPPHPFIFEINTWPWLEELSGREGRPIDLGTVPGAHWDEVAAAGADAVWLMGAWQRSPAGVALALSNAGLIADFQRALPDFRAGDVVGSPYCIRDYVVDQSVGGPDGLAAARVALAERGCGLILDFVPNHVAPDHPWTAKHPDRFVQGTIEDLEREPTSFIEVAGRVLANGRDPFFPAWPDVVQLNAFSADLRSAVVETLGTIADQCDGVRCDMAMLLMNDTFERTWGSRAGARPDDDYWPSVIPAVRQTHGDFLFIAEAYWDLEWALQEQGFDYCYDKRLYDRLLHDGAEEVGRHLRAEDRYQERLVRFLENHDEPRAASLLDSARQKALTVATLTQTGARLVHHGQAEGRRVRLPVFLGRFPTEAPDDDLAAFHGSLAAALRDPTFRHGRWRLCDRSGWDGDRRFENLVAWCWDGETRWLVVVNLSDTTAAGRVRAPWDDLRGEACRLVDSAAGQSYDRTGDDVCDGLFVELGPWGWHLFQVETGESA
jgi:hypothetical protein